MVNLIDFVEIVYDSSFNIKSIPNKMGVVIFIKNEKITNFFHSQNIRNETEININERNFHDFNKIKYFVCNDLIQAIEIECEIVDEEIWTYDFFTKRLIDINFLYTEKKYHMALIYTISTLEAYLKEKFKQWKDYWFLISLKNVPKDKKEKELRKKIILIVKDLGIKESIIEEFFILGKQMNKNECIDYLYYLLFEKNEYFNGRTLSFQQFKGKYSGIIAYKEFFDLNFQIILGSDWETLRSLAILRHRIIHGTVRPLDKLINEEDALNAKRILERIYKIMEDHYNEHYLNL